MTWLHLVALALLTADVLGMFVLVALLLDMRSPKRKHRDDDGPPVVA